MMRMGDLVFWIFLFFIVGVWFFGLGMSLKIVAVLMATIFCLGLFYFVLKNKKEVLWMSFLLVFIFGGYFYSSWYDRGFSNDLGLKNSGEQEVSGEIISNPKISSSAISFIIENKARQRIYVVTKPTLDFEYGDVFIGKGTVEELKEEDKFLAKDWVIGKIVYPKEFNLEKSKSFSLMRSLYSFEKDFALILSRLYPNNEGALAIGMLLGQQVAGFSKEFVANMKTSGTTHITALSGYNITVVVLVVSLCLGFFIPTKYNFYATMGFVFLFVVMTGASASVVRAALMGFLILLAQKESRIYSFKNGVVVVAFLMVLLNPRVLVFDIGFILSFVALFGITFIAPILDSLKTRRFESERVEDVWKIFCQTIGAQVAVLPILSFYFGQFSWVGVVSNVLILLFVPMAMALAFLLGFVGMVWFGLARLISIVFYPIFGYMVGVINLFGSFVGVVFQMNIWTILVYYLCLIFIVAKYYPKVREKMYNLL